MFFAVNHDRRFGNIDIGCKQFHAGITVQRFVLHMLESIDKARPAVWINEVVAAMHGDGNGICFLCGRQTERDCQHDSIAVRHDGGLHGLLGVVAVWNLDIVGQGRSAEMTADAGDVDDMMGNGEARGTSGGEVEFLAMPLAVVEGDQSR